MVTDITNTIKLCSDRTFQGEFQGGKGTIYVELPDTGWVELLSRVGNSTPHHVMLKHGKIITMPFAVPVGTTGILRFPMRPISASVVIDSATSGDSEDIQQAIAEQQQAIAEQKQAITEQQRVIEQQQQVINEQVRLNEVQQQQIEINKADNEAQQIQINNTIALDEEQQRQIQANTEMNEAQELGIGEDAANALIESVFGKQ